MQASMLQFFICYESKKKTIYQTEVMKLKRFNKSAFNEPIFARENLT